MIYGPQYNPNIHRVDPVDRDRAEKDGKQKKKVLYKGRSYSEKDEDLPVQPKEPKTQPVREHTVYADRVLMQKAKKFFTELTTLEERVAQLCFLEVDALYDKEMQLSLEMIIQLSQIGGVVFRKGDYKRQSYLITRFQEISKTPLLIANKFSHGLSFYLQGDVLKSELSEQHVRDLGKAVMVQNRRMGVHIQFDEEKVSLKSTMTERQAKAFRKGIREAQGIVGKQSTEKTLSFNMILPFKREELTFFPEPPVQETIGYKALSFLNVTKEAISEEAILKAFRENYDVFLFSKETINEMIPIICHLVHSGRISEEELDKRVLKILVMKAHFLKK